MTWTLRDRAAAVVFFVALVTMIALPLSRFLEEDPGRFGWHMFSLGRELPEFTVVPAAGDPYVIEPRSYVASLRSDVPLADELPQHLCNVIPDAVQVLVAVDTGVRTVECPP